MRTCNVMVIRDSQYQSCGWTVDLPKSKDRDKEECELAMAHYRTVHNYSEAQWTHAYRKIQEQLEEAKNREKTTASTTSSKENAPSVDSTRYDAWMAQRKAEQA